jgi:hypothetical protein
VPTNRFQVSSYLSPWSKQAALNESKSQGLETHRIG